jgi:hypothetical protein
VTSPEARGAPQDGPGSSAEVHLDAGRDRLAHRSERVLVTVSVGVIVVSLALVATFGHGRDQGIYAVVARAIGRGGMPYRDAWDFKPPGIFVIYALARGLFGASQLAIRLVEVAGLAAMSWAMVRIARLWWGAPRIGYVAAAIAALVHAQLDFWHTAQPESFGGMVTIFALLVLTGPLQGEGREAGDAARGALARCVIAGALFGFAGLLKPPLAGGAVAVAVFLGVRAYRQRGLGAALRPVLALGIGGVLPIALCAMWFWAKGALGDLYQVLFVFTPNYTAIGWRGQSALTMLYWGVTQWLTNYASVTTVGLLLCLALHPRSRERPGVFLMLGIIAVHLVGIVMQGKFFPYHYGATWPLTAMIAAVGFDRFWERASARGAVGAAVFFLALGGVLQLRSATKDVAGTFASRSLQRLALFSKPATLLGAASPDDQRAIDKLASVADVNAVANREVAEWIRREVPAGRRVFVWGFEPVIYEMADRDPATRYIYDVPQRVTWGQREARELLMRELAAHPPAAIVVENNDVFPQVTGDSVDSADTVPKFPAFQELVYGRYRHHVTIEDFDVYLEIR